MVYGQRPIGEVFDLRRSGRTEQAQDR